MRVLYNFLCILLVSFTLTCCGHPPVNPQTSALPHLPRSPGSVQEKFMISAVQGTEGSVIISFTLPSDSAAKKIELFRSTADLRTTPFDIAEYPITRYMLSDHSVGKSFLDAFTAHNTVYYYVAILYKTNGSAVASDVVLMKTASNKLTFLRKPSLLIDKVHYFLEVRDGGRMIRRFPIALGRDPVKRKLHQDNATTPEGIYEINNVQPNATYYKAYDLNYPNSIDTMRYDFARKKQDLPLRSGVTPSIGGEIQIHGMGSMSNWTFGCIALQNSDMDELFSHGEIGIGTPVVIVGREITGEDILSAESVDLRDLQVILAEKGYYNGDASGIFDEMTADALGEYQKVNKLPVTCQPDSRTVKKLFSRH